LDGLCFAAQQIDLGPVWSKLEFVDVLLIEEWKILTKKEENVEEIALQTTFYERLDQYPFDQPRGELGRYGNLRGSDENIANIQANGEQTISFIVKSLHASFQFIRDKLKVIASEKNGLRR